jgi:hypothetical protein
MTAAPDAGQVSANAMELRFREIKKKAAAILESVLLPLVDIWLPLTLHRGKTLASSTKDDTTKKPHQKKRSKKDTSPELDREYYTLSKKLKSASSDDEKLEE